MTNPYEVLGVPVGASEEEIHFAYRDAAKQAHPDAGGSTDAFTALQGAYLVLKDPLRRAKFDSTGDTSPCEAEAHIGLLCSLLAEFLSVCKDPWNHNSTEVLKEELLRRKHNIKNQQQHILCEQERFQKCLGTLQRKKGANFLEGVIEQKLLTTKKAMALAEADLDVIAKALSTLSEFTFTGDLHVYTSTMGPSTGRTNPNHQSPFQGQGW